MYNCSWSGVIWTWYLTHMYISCWLWYYTKGRFCYSCVDLKVIYTSRIFLFGTLYIDSLVQGVDVILTTNITDFKISWFLVEIIRWKWYEIFFLERGRGVWGEEGWVGVGRIYDLKKGWEVSLIYSKGTLWMLDWSSIWFLWDRIDIRYLYIEENRSGREVRGYQGVGVLQWWHYVFIIVPRIQ